jgi:hypothetical protein
MNYEEELAYWKQRCLIAEFRRDMFEREIARLKGYKPLTKEDIEQHNERVAAGQEQ